ncbi:MAG TPA: hypothetical protein VGS28_01125 [Candidatus Saccharimonadales bacterium]|nr:hypothetical protein [Candidatus Saccharimonadales bacterium]
MGTGQHETLVMRDSLLFGTRVDERTHLASTAMFFVEVSQDGSSTAVYKLTAMNERDFAAWKLEQEVNPDGETDLETTHSPLLVRDADLSRDGLVTFIERRYLDTRKPGAINEIRDHLEGPIVTD